MGETVAAAGRTDSRLDSRELDSWRFQRMFRPALVFALLVHGLLIPASVALGVYTLAAANLLSILSYVAIVALHVRRHTGVALTLFICETITHALVATYLLGWDAGFHYYILAVTPVTCFYTPWSLSRRLMLLLAFAVGYGVMSLHFSTLPMPATLSVQTTAYLNTLNGGALFLAFSLLTLYYAAAVHNAEERTQAANRQLHRLAETDPLTGLFNRRTAVRGLGHALSVDESFSVAIADLDHFKRVNDEQGHNAGDRVLACAAETLSAQIRDGDIIARWGGEEFLVLLPGTDEDGAWEICERLRGAIGRLSSETIAVDVHLTVTIGVAERRSDDTPESLVARADDALLMGKRTGRNRVVRGSTLH